MMDDLLREFIIDNKLSLTLLAIVSAPVGLYTGWRFLTRSGERLPLPAPDLERRLESVEMGLETLVAEVSRLSQQNARLAAVLEREQLPRARAEGAPRAVTPVQITSE